MQTTTYSTRRSQIETYFDRTAMQAWASLTSEAPVSRIRATVRAGRQRMRDTLLSWLPSDLRGSRLLDAGCGTGAFAIEAARRGADVTAVDLAPTLVDIAHQRVPRDLGHGSIDFQSGDMLDPSLGSFDYVIAMDSLIHYSGLDCIDALAELSARTEQSVLFTFAPRTPSLAVMHAIGKLFPRSERAPSIQPIANRAITQRIERDPRLAECSIVRTERIAGGFYISQAMELGVR
jgi:magnesium-protoporphyrin O-methyltransferase